MSLAALLISPDRDVARQLTATLAESHAFQVLADLNAYPPKNTLEIRLRQLKPDVLLIDVATDAAQALELIRFVGTCKPVVQAVGLHRTNDSQAVVNVLRAGASEFLYQPFDPQEQREAVTRLKRLRQPETESTYELGQVIVFSSAKPGSGSSTISAHAAHAVRKLTGKRVLLIDLDLEGGTIAFYLKVQPTASVVDALAQAGKLQAGPWTSLVASTGGLDILASPDQPHSEPVDPAGLHELFEFARTMYDWVIVDAPTIFHRHGLLALSESDRTFLVSTGDLASLHLARKAVNMLEQLGLPKERYQVVINRLSRRDGIGGSDIEKIFNSPVFASLPNDYFPLHRVISLGQPLAADCELGRALANLAARISAPPEEKKAPPPAAEQRPAFSQT
ncbi:MAG: AAA family ATPase [Bryobacteraceae bacterium]